MLAPPTAQHTSLAASLIGVRRNTPLSIGSIRAHRVGGGSAGNPPELPSLAMRKVRASEHRRPARRRARRGGSLAGSFASLMESPRRWCAVPRELAREVDAL